MARIMVVDSGARGHAIALAYLNSGYGEEHEILLAPSNDGIVGDVINLGVLPHSPRISKDSSVSLKDPNSILEAARRFKPDFVDVAQDDALAAGAVDLLQAEGFTVFGPTREAARIEWDKAWAREFMQTHNIPHPEFRIFQGQDTDSVSYAEQLIKRDGIAFFKASGLAAGKGVIPVRSSREIDSAFDAMQKSFGDAGNTFLVEEGMKGEEFSYYALTDGENIIYFPSAQDNKRLLNWDEGPNTGGMGAHSPARITEGFEKKIEEEIIARAITGLAQEGRPYKGILYLGGMVCEDGSIKVVEFNSRWGDPEAQVILPGVRNYLGLVKKAIEGDLGNIDRTSLTDGKTRVGIVAASRGYPGEYEKGKRIERDYGNIPDSVKLFSAGIKVVDGKFYTDGGRLFTVVGEGKSVKDARVDALKGMACVNIEGGFHYRTDVGMRDVDREMKS